MKQLRRPPAHLQDDPGVHGTRRVWRVPEENRTGDDGHLSPLQGRQGHGTAHAGALSGIGVVPLHPVSRHRRKIDPLGDCRSDVERATGI